MDIINELAFSYYKEIASLNDQHKVYLVQHSDSKRIYVKKVLEVFNYDVYSFLRSNPIMGIPKIYELAQSGNSLVIIEDFIPGRSIEDIINDEGAFTENQTINYMLKLCDILAKLHAANPSIIHRDIKPSNIMVTPMDEVVLIDMNAAKLASDKVEDTTLLGTKGYAAPEQYGFGSSNVQTDIYAIGIVMNTMISGTYSQEIQNGKLSNIIKKCTQLSPKSRYKSITELSDALLTISQKPPSHTYAGWRSYLPPGFRSGNYIFMLIATFYYIFAFWICKDLAFKDATEHSTMIQRSGSFLIFIFVALCTCNYAGIQDRFKIHKIKNPILRTLGIVLLNLIVMFIIVLLTVLLSAF